MRQSRFTEERIIAILREHEAGSKTGDACRTYGVSSATFYKWKAKYGGLDVSEAVEDRERQAEEAAGRGDAQQRHAEGSPTQEMVTPAAKRQAVAHLCYQYEVSQRRACSAIGVDRTSVRYRSRRSDDGIIRARLRELATTRRRFGCRRLLLIIRREGLKIITRRCGVCIYSYCRICSVISNIVTGFRVKQRRSERAFDWARLQKMTQRATRALATSFRWPHLPTSCETLCPETFCIRKFARGFGGRFQQSFDFRLFATEGCTV